MADGDIRLYPLFDALSGDMLLRPFYPNTPTPHYITLDQIAGFVGQGSIGPEGPEGPPGPAGPEGPAGPAGPPGTGEGASGLSGMVAGQIPIAATATTVTSSAALSGDISSNATLVTTLASVNSNVGTFQGLTLDAKGRVTAATNQSYLTAAALTPYAPLASPALTGTPTAPTAGAGTNTTQIATTAFVVQSFAPIGSPTFTGDPKAPTPATGDNDTSIATTAFVKAQNYLTANQAITLSGDLSGSGTTAISATVTQLQGRSVSNTAPTSDQILQWNGSAWTPTTISTGGGSGTITGVTAGTGLTGGGTTGAVTLNISVPVAVIHGGTGAIDAAAARTNLAVLPIASPTTTGKLTTAATVAGSAGFSLPHGTPPSTPVAGDMWTTTTGVGVRISSTTRFFAFLSGGTYTGKIITNASDSTAAGLNLPHGAAPSSPSNGDLWTTSAGGLFARINGATQNYFTTAGGTLTGNLGISGTLSLNGVTFATNDALNAGYNKIFDNSDTACVLLGNGGTTTYNIYKQSGHQFTDRAGTVQARFDGAGCAKPGGGAWTDSSDIRLKHSIKQYCTGLDTLTQLRPVTYQFNGLGETADDGRVFTGLVADEVREVMPELVGTRRGRLRPDDGEEIDILTLDATALIYALVNAVRELSVRVAELEEHK